MGRTRSSRQCLRQAASDVRPAVIDTAAVIDAPHAPAAVDAPDAGAPEARRTALHGHG